MLVECKMNACSFLTWPSCFLARLLFLCPLQPCTTPCLLDGQVDDFLKQFSSAQYTYLLLHLSFLPASVQGTESSTFLFYLEPWFPVSFRPILITFTYACKLLYSKPQKYLRNNPLFFSIVQPLLTHVQSIWKFKSKWNQWRFQSTTSK